MALLLHRMSRRDMTDFMADDAGDFGFGVQVGEDAARDVDVAAGERESVDLIAVDDGEVEFEFRAVRELREPLTDAVDVILQRLVFIDAVGSNDLLVSSTFNVRRTYVSDARRATMPNAPEARYNPAMPRTSIPMSADTARPAATSRFMAEAAAPRFAAASVLMNMMFSMIAGMPRSAICTKEW